jgi:class 3 adenylate cyclase
MPNEQATPMLLFSIDVSKSTISKARLREFAPTIGKEPSDLYEDYYRQILNIEASLWEMLHARKIPIEPLFHLKSLGDEIWYSYDLRHLAEWEMRRSIVQIVLALLDLQTKTFTMVASPDEEPHGWEPSNDVDPKSILRVQLPRKITAELAFDGIDLRELREAILKPHAVRLLSPFGAPPEQVKDGNPEFISLCNRLHLGVRIATGSSVVSQSRTDLMGWEIDRFFRLAGHARPEGVLIGPYLLDCIRDLIASTNEPSEVRIARGPGKRERWSHGPVMIRIPHGGGFTSDGTCAIARRTLSNDELRGVGEGGEIAICFNTFSDLPSLLKESPSKSSKNPSRPKSKEGPKAAMTRSPKSGNGSESPVRAQSESSEKIAD